MDLRYIGVDFDGTIVETADFPNVGELRPYAKETLAYLKEQGFVLILWTCRVGKELELAKDFLKENEIEFDFFNENPKELIDLFGEDCRKIGADVFIDDRNLAIGAFEVDWLFVKMNAQVNWNPLTYEKYKKRLSGE